MNKSISVFNFSGIYEDESFYRQDKGSSFCAAYDLTKVPGTNCMCDDAARSEIERIITENKIPIKGLHFIDSGNYHYMSAILTSFVREPFSLVVLDHHPDMQPPMFGDILSCGGWVLDVMEKNEYIRDIHVIGADRDLISQLDEKDRKRALFYDSDRALDVIDRIEHPVYLSIDKDVLMRRDLITNWDQGDMSIDELLGFAERLKERHEIIGIDICGECAPDQEGIDVPVAVKVNDEFNWKIGMFFAG